MCLRIPPDLDSSTTMFPAAADLSDACQASNPGRGRPESDASARRKPNRPDAKEVAECNEELERLYRVCRAKLQGLYRVCRAKLESLYWQGLDCCDLEQLRQVETDCWNRLWVIIRRPLETFSFSRVWKQVLELRRRVEQALHAFPSLVIFSVSSAVEGGIYINIGSQTTHVPDHVGVNHPLLQMVLFADRKFHGGSFGCLKSMAPRFIVRKTETSGSSAEYRAYWIPANWKSESPNAVRSPRCGSKKLLLPVLFNISASKKTSSTVYDSSMAVAAGNCDKQHCKIEHLRKIGLASEDDTLKAINIYMMEGSHGVSADRSMQYLTILDSGAAYHCTGDRSQLSDYHDGVAPVLYLRGAGGTVMRVHGTGSIHNENFQVKGVLYIPGLNNQPNISKTIFSVSKLNDLGFDILFNSDGTVSVMNLEHGIVGKAWNFRGLFMLDYLRIPDNRAPVAMLEGRRPGLVKSFWNASLSVWTSITSRLSQRATYAQRPPV